jgi:hypothetical protein
MSFTNRDILTVSLPICIPFTFSSYLIALARNSSGMLNKSGDRGLLCLVPDFRGNGFSFSPLSMMLAIGLSNIDFKMLRYIPSIPSFLRDFYHEIFCKHQIGSFDLQCDLVQEFIY